MTDPRPSAEDVLIAHQRHRGACLCGWGELGRSHARHVVEQLTAAGRLLPEPLETRAEWGVQWHGMDVVTEQGGIPYDEQSARAVAARCPHAVAVCRRKADPWVAVDPDTKEQP